MSKTSPARRPTRPAPSPHRKPVAAGAAAPPSKRFPIALVIGAILAAGLVAIIVVTMGSGGSGELEVGTPVVTGEALPPFDTVDNDTSLGLAIPEVTGADFTGAPVSIARDGRAKMLVFVAHWCGVCRQEVPLIMDWLPGATLPDGIDLISVTTGINSASPNYPPSEWLAREGWTLPLIVDDAASTVGRAFGLTAYPYFVFVNAEGQVVLRLTGALPTATIESIIAELAQA